MTGTLKSQVLMMAALLLAGPVGAQLFSRQTVSQTPYDPYMTAYHEVASLSPGRLMASMEQIEEWTDQAYDFHYEHTDAYRARSPAQVEASGEGDCKDKALWLYAKLAAAGVREVHLVVGQKDSIASEFHAWVYFQHDGRTYLADPTFSGSVRPVSDFDMDEYIPAFSYSGSNSFAYNTAAAAFDPRYQGSIPSVAGR